MDGYPTTDGEERDPTEVEEIVDFADVEDPYEMDDFRDPDANEPVTKLARWRKRSTTGMILTGIGLGLQEVFGPKRDEVAIVREAPGENEDEDVVLHFDPDSPENTWMEIRRPRDD